MLSFPQGQKKTKKKKEKKQTNCYARIVRFERGNLLEKANDKL